MTTDQRKHRRVFVAGHRGLVGSALVRRLEHEADVETLVAGREDMDLRRQDEVEAWMNEHRPHQIYLVAGTVGGIIANSTRPAEFLYDNIMIHANLIEAARNTGVTKLL